MEAIEAATEFDNSRDVNEGIATINAPENAPIMMTPTVMVVRRRGRAAAVGLGMGRADTCDSRGFPCTLPLLWLNEGRCDVLVPREGLARSRRSNCSLSMVAKVS